ncbi:transposase [Kiritimatiellota bacterium B12222]|nr:transposase [Kiritimatiellota bacterium B12222]
MSTPLTFRPYQPSASDIVYRDKLPHRSRKGRTIFITWRLSDSLPPLAVLEESIRQAQGRWLAKENLHLCPWSQDVEKILKHQDPEKQLAYRRVSFRVREQFAAKKLGSCVLGQQAAVEALRQAIFEEEKWGSGIGDLVVCYNHVHLLMVPDGEGDLQQPMQRIKGRASRYLGLAGLVNLPKPIWQRSWFDHVVRNQHKLARIRKYIADHPVPCRDAYYKGVWT